MVVLGTCSSFPLDLRKKIQFCFPQARFSRKCFFLVIVSQARRYKRGSLHLNVLKFCSLVCAAVLSRYIWNLYPFDFFYSVSYAKCCLTPLLWSFLWIRKKSIPSGFFFCPARKFLKENNDEKKSRLRWISLITHLALAIHKTSPGNLSIFITSHIPASLFPILSLTVVLQNAHCTFLIMKCASSY